MKTSDIRWEQRFSNFLRALEKLEETLKRIESTGSIGKQSNDQLSRQLSDLEKEGLIQRFEYVHELAWNVIKDYFEYQGNTGITGSRDATREGFKMGLIDDGECWMDMIFSRNLTSHTYNAEVAELIFLRIVREYYPAFIFFKTKMGELRS